MNAAWQRLTLRRGRAPQAVLASNRAAPKVGRGVAWLARAIAATRIPDRFRRPLAMASRLTLVGTTLAAAAALAASLGPQLLGYSSVVVYGGSMADSISAGSIAVTEEVQPENVGVGNVIVFHPPAASANSPPLMHRVVSVREENGQRFFRTKGDANQTPDPVEVALQDAGSRVVYTVPYVGYLVHFAQTLLGWLLLVALPVAYLGLTGLRRIWSRERLAR